MNSTYWVKARDPTRHPTMGRNYCFYTNRNMDMVTVSKLRVVELKIDTLISSMTENRLQAFPLWECLK